VNEFCHLTVDGGPLLAVRSLTGRERIGEPFRFEVRCVLPDGPADVALMLTQSATLEVEDGSDKRTIVGQVDEVEVLDDVRVLLVLVPRSRLLADTMDFRVFVQKDAVAIAKEVLGEHGISVEDEVSAAPPVLAMCVQSFESDLRFVGRILAEQGISWVQSTADGARVHLRDTHFPDSAAGTLSVRDDSMGHEQHAIFEPLLAESATTRKVVLRDYDFTHPELDQTVEAGDDAVAAYEYPGGYVAPAVGRTIARRRLEEARAFERTLEGWTTHRGLTVGEVLEVEDGAGIVGGRWLLVEVVHEGDLQSAEGQAYRARFVAQSETHPFRPARVPAPPPAGVMTATVTSGGQELATDEFGRLTAQLRWERRRPADDKASGPIRVTMPATSGSVFLPRTGWEVLLAFDESLDAPLELARLYNSSAPPPAKLPGKKTSSSFGSKTMGGASGNVITLDDTAGSEALSLSASKDYNEKTENDKVTNVVADDTTTVGANQKIIVGQVARVEVGGAQSYSVGAVRKLGVDANMGIQAASETVMIGAMRAFRVGGDYVTTCATLTRLVGAAKAETAIEHQSRHVTGAATTLVGGTWKVASALGDSQQVSGASTLLVAGAKKVVAAGKVQQQYRGILQETLASRKVDARGDYHESFGGVISYQIGAASSLKGAEVTIEATARLSLRAGGCTITITPAKITIDGKFDGSVDSEDSTSSEEVG